MPDRESNLDAAEFAALQAVVKAIARAQVKRSRLALDDMLDYLQVEAERLTVESQPPGSNEKSAAAALEDWIETLKADAALWDVEPANTRGRRIHFLD